ncbi:unnamed protein product [Allacma fusca]|uniref:Uncharacterized protein n=1 Tax=Allacma fusca TaxID=39272 RepID=A0A8J2Q1X2_9HEXA|nr:unnamed protein product [Allacma fusca]
MFEDCFRSTHSREPSGRYVVELPFRPDDPTLGASKERARARFLQERRLLLNRGHKHLYIVFMQEYERLGHMIPKPENEIDYPIPPPVATTSRTTPYSNCPVQPQNAELFLTPLLQPLMESPSTTSFLTVPPSKKLSSSEISITRHPIRRGY